MRLKEYTEADEEEILRGVTATAAVDVSFDYTSGIFLTKTGKSRFLVN